MAHVEISRIEPSRFQPRRVFDEASLKGLAESIKASGVMQPVIVRVVVGKGPGARVAAQSSGESVARGGAQVVTYELVAGERRWRAAEMAGLARIPAIVRELSDEEAAAWALVENVQREDLNAMERAWAFRALSEKFGLTQAQIAERVGLDRVSVANTMRLTELEEAIRSLIETGKLSGGHGKALLMLTSGAARVGLAQKCVREGWSVRRLELEAAQVVMDANGGAGKNGRGGPILPAEAAKLASRMALEKQLGEHLGTKVRIETDKAGTKGKLVVEFYGLDHFDGLLGKMGFGK